MSKHYKDTLGFVTNMNGKRTCGASCYSVFASQGKNRGNNRTGANCTAQYTGSEKNLSHAKTHSNGCVEGA